MQKKNTKAKKILREYRVDKVENYKTGNELGLELLKDKKFVDVKSKTIGKGFAGAMKDGILVAWKSFSWCFNFT